jgi:hypothetical protein
MWGSGEVPCCWRLRREGQWVCFLPLDLTSSRSTSVNVLPTLLGSSPTLSIISGGRPYSRAVAKAPVQRIDGRAKARLRVSTHVKVRPVAFQLGHLSDDMSFVPPAD